MLNESEYDLQDYADWGGLVPGVSSGFQVTGMIEWGQKPTPPPPSPNKKNSLGLQKKKKIPWTEI